MLTPAKAKVKQMQQKLRLRQWKKLRRKFWKMLIFRQRLNRAGLPYGWHLALVQTPETKWGYAAFSAGYRESPETSWERITAKVRVHFPEASEGQLRKLLGIRLPKK